MATAKTQALPTDRRTGKISRQGVVRTVIQEMLDRGEDVSDRKKILLIAKKRLESYPADKRQGLTIRPVDVKQVHGKMTMGWSTHSTPKQPVVQPTTAPSESSAPDMFAASELLSARRYLSECGNNLVKAQTLINLMSSLTKGD